MDDFNVQTNNYPIYTKKLFFLFLLVYRGNAAAAIDYVNEREEAPKELRNVDLYQLRCTSLFQYLSHAAFPVLGLFFLYIVSRSCTEAVIFHL